MMLAVALKWDGRAKFDTYPTIDSVKKLSRKAATNGTRPFPPLLEQRKR
jgi:hypothetical protein